MVLHRRRAAFQRAGIPDRLLLPLLRRLALRTAASHHVRGRPQARGTPAPDAHPGPARRPARRLSAAVSKIDQRDSDYTQRVYSNRAGARDRRVWVCPDGRVEGVARKAGTLAWTTG